MEQNRIDYIDSLRGVAALLIVYFHVPTIAQGGPYTIPWWSKSFNVHVADIGVPMFFSLSAFLLTKLAFSYKKYKNPVIAFYLKRFFRIAPLFYATAIWWIFWRFLTDQPPYPFGRIAMTFSLLFNAVPNLSTFNIVFAGWTVGVEVLFYLVFPFIMVRLTRRIVILVAAVLISFVVASGFDVAARHLAQHDSIPRIYYLIGMPHHLPAFMMGMLAFPVFEHLSSRRDRRSVGLILLCAAAIIVSGLMSGRADFLVSPRHWQQIAAVVFMLGFFLIDIPVGRTAMSWIGRISYSIYLLHGPVIAAFGGVFVWLHANLSENVAFITSFVAAASLVIPVSWVSYNLIEKPGIALGNGFISRFRYTDSEPARLQSQA